MSHPAPKPLDILCFGEPMFEFSFVDEDTIRPGIGGDVSNTAVAAARAGAKAGMLTHLGSDNFAERILTLYVEEGIDASRVVQSETAPTGLYFIEYGPEGHQFSYRRSGSAASLMGPDDLTPEMFEGVGVLHISGITQAISTSSCTATVRAAELARATGARVSFDTNLRLNLWSAEDARQALIEILPLVDVVFPSLEDAEALFGTSGVDEICERFLAEGAELVVLTLGEDGAVVADAKGQVAIAPCKAELVDATGAGDTFDGSFLAEYARTSDPVAAAQFACAAASLSVESIGAVKSIPMLDAIRARQS